MKKFRILHCGLPNYALSKAFVKMGEYMYFDWTDYFTIPGNEGNLRRRTLEIAREFKPDITFLQLQHPDPYDAETLRQIPGFKVHWTWDFRPDIKWMMDLATGVDVTCFTNELQVEQMRSAGFKSEFLQSGFDDETFTPVGSRVDVSPDIVFMGNNYDKATYNFPMSDFRIEMVDRLRAKYGDKFEVFGYGWDFPTRSFVHREGKEAEIYRSCLMAINVAHYETNRYTSDRILRLLGSGAFCLCKWYPSIEKDFVDGVHLRTWSTLEELDELIGYYVEHVDERKEIATRGCKYAHDNYTWKRMIGNLIKMI